MKKILFIFLMFFCFKLLFSQGSQEGKPEALLPETLHDVGDVLKGTKIQYSFTIRNTGTATLKIFKAQPG